MSYQMLPYVSSNLGQMDSNVESQFNQYPQTLRYPTTQDASAVSQNDLVAQQLDNNASSLRQRLYMLFTYYHDYTTFSNEAWIDSNNNLNGYDSIESLHDQIHGLTGNGGHMTYIDYSAFDPLFWLHHAMVDRCFAMWQILNPNSYVAPEPAKYSTFTNSAGQTQDVNSLLTPFHKDVTGDFWTSEDVRSTETFGYSYPETTNYAGGNSTSQVIEAINRLYGPIATASSQLDSRSLPSRISGNASSDPRSWEWTANIRVQKCALAVPFYIHIFIGPFSPDPFPWSFDPNLVGTHFVFVKAFSTFSAPCHCNSDQMVGATIPLTDSLVKNINQGNLKTLDPDDVNPFLAKNLSYRLSYLNDTEISKGSVPSLKISVVSVAVTKPRSNDELPRWGNLRGHMDVSTG
jgi:tyrosinase